MTCNRLTHEDVLRILPDRDPRAHKGSFGKILLLCGSRGFTGAAALAAMGALRSGAGLVYLGVPDCIYAIEAVKLTEPVVLPLPDNGNTISEAAIADIIDNSIAAKAGHNSEAHNQNDVGSFQIFKNGQQILADLGAGVYDKFYFSEIRYSIFCAGSQGHNVPIINGETQKCGRKYAAENVSIDKNGMSYDFQAAYDVETLEKLHRDLRFDNKTGEVHIEDTYRFTEIPTSVTERYVTEFEPKLGDGVVTIAPENAEMSLYYDKNTWNVSVYVEHKSRGGANYECISYCIDFSPIEPQKEMKFVLDIR
jgi:hypothetical protein